MKHALIRAGLAAAMGMGLCVGVLWLLGGRPPLVQAAPALAPQRAPMLQGAPELTVTKQVEPVVVQAGQPLTYTIVVTNSGNVTLTAAITDVLPGEVSPGGVLTWTTVLSLPPDAVWSHQFTVTAQLGYSGTLTNVVQATSQEGAGGVYTATSLAQTTPALTVTKQASPNPVQAGQVLTYTLWVTNTGNQDLTAAITDTLPAQVSPGGLLTWTEQLITAPMGVWMMPVTVSVPYGYSGTLTNVVRVTSLEGARGVYTATAQARTTPALTVTKQVTPAVVQAGQMLTYTILVTNTGNTTLTASITDSPPSHANPTGNLSWSGQVITAPLGAWTAEVPISADWNYSGTLTNVVRVTSLEGAGASYTLTSKAQTTPALTVTKWATPTNVQAGQMVTYTIRVTNTGNVTLTADIADTPDSTVFDTKHSKCSTHEWTSQLITAPLGVWTNTFECKVKSSYAGSLTNTVQVTSDEGASGTYVLISHADVTPALTVTKQVTPAIVQAGQLLTYTIWVSNTGNQDLNAAITDTLPAQVSPPGQQSWTAVISAESDLWTQQVMVTAQIGYSGTLTNAVQVTSLEGASDAYTATSQARVTPALTVTKQVTPAVVQAGQVLTYTLWVTNTGNQELHAAITDTLPAQVLPGGVLTWTEQLITAPVGVWITPVTVSVPYGYSGTLTNRVQVTTLEGVGAVYTTTSQAQVTPALTVTKQASPNPVPAGEVLTYTLWVTNTGNQDLNADITDTLPAQVLPGGVLAWTGQLITAPRGTWSTPVTVSVPYGYSGTLTNLVQVTSLEGASGGFSITSRALVTPALVVGKWVDPDPVNSGNRLTYTLRVTNTGNITLNTTITDILPAQVQPGGVLTWQAVLSVPDGSWAQSIPLKSSVSYSGTLTNEVRVTSQEGATGTLVLTSAAYRICQAQLNDGPVFASVQDAVDASSSPDDVVRVAGYCTELQVRQGITQAVYISKTLTMQGGWNSDFTEYDPASYATTLDAGGHGRVLVVGEGASPTIEGLTITGGWWNAFDVQDGGAGIYVITATPTIRGNVIHGNVVTGTQARGGGVYLVDSSGAQIISNTVRANSAGPNGDGGGISLFGGSDAVLTRNLVISNTALRGGGILLDSSPNALLAANQVMSNSASDRGGGVLFRKATGYTMVNNVLAGNQAALRGSAVLVNDAVVQMLHTTIANSGGGPNGVYAWGNSTLALTNTILVSQTVGIYAESGSSAMLDGVLWYGNAGDTYGEPGSSITVLHAVSGDPAFVNPAGEDYHIGPGSAAVNGGWEAGVATDLDGVLRDAAPDLGAYERRTCTVRLNGDSTDYGTVQDALDASTGGDLVKVAGYCPGVRTLGGLGQNAFIDQTVTLQGGYTVTDWLNPDPVVNPTTLDGLGRGRVVYLTGAIAPTVEGLRLTGGDATGLGGGRPAGDAGGGVYVVTATATISGSWLFGNVAQYGAGLEFVASSGTLTGSAVFSNAASVTGGGVHLWQSTAALVGNAIYSNTATSAGGGVHLYYSPANMTGNRVFSNNTSGSGGGVAMDNSAATVNATRITSNTAVNGGGLHLLNSSAALNGNLILSNQASQGGGLYLANSPAAFTNTVVANNQVSGSGSGILVASGAPRLLHSTIVANRGGDGSGVFVDGGSLALTNTILVSHTLGISVAAGSAQVNDVLWFGNDANFGGAVSVTRAITGPPAFADPDAGDYHLTLGSAAIDGGTYTGVDVDIDGNPRPHDGPDLGVAEYPYAVKASKTAFPDPVQALAVLTYTLRVTNTGFLPLWATITDTLPAEVSPSGDLTWTAQLTALNGVWVQPVTVTVAVGVTGTLTNVLRVTTDQGAMTAFTGTSRAYWTAALSVTKQAVPDTVAAGSWVTYTLSVTNTGSVTLTATITDQVQPAEAVVDGSDVVTWQASITAPKGIWTQLLTVTINPSYSNTVTNLVTVTTDRGASGAYSRSLIAQVPISGLVVVNDSPTEYPSVTTLTATVSAGSHISYTWNYGDGQVAGGGAFIPNGAVITRSYDLPPATITRTVVVTASNGVSWMTATGVVTLARACWVRLASNPLADYGVVQTALNAASTPDVVMVAGTCRALTNTGGSWQIAYLNKALTLRGGYTTTNWINADPVANPTTLDAHGGGRVLVISGAIAPTVEGLRLTGGAMTGQDGGGVYVYGGGAPILSRLWVFSNTARSGGGVLFVSSAGTLTNSSVYSNWATTNGGGVYLSQSPATLNGNTVYSNTAAAGGGVYLYGGLSAATLTGNGVLSNSATGDGGGLLFYGAPALFNDNTVSGNSAGGNGGGLDITNNGAVRLSANRVLSNLALRGGGLYLANSPAALTNTVIADNQATSQGSGVFISGSSPRLWQTTIADNSGGEGTGLYISSGTAVLTNTIVASHTLGMKKDSAASVTLNGLLWYSNTTDYGGTGTFTFLSVPVRGDPAFLDPNAGDYHIGPNSAAKDAGVNSGVPVDIDGQTRPIPLGYGQYDIGADEFPAALALTKQASSAWAPLGAPLTYTIRATNTGVVPLTNVVVTDTLPTQVDPSGDVTWPAYTLNPGGLWTQVKVVVVTDTVETDWILTNVVTATAQEGIGGVATNTTSTNLEPVAVAGPAQYVPANVDKTVLMDGGASYDQDCGGPDCRSENCYEVSMPLCMLGGFYWEQTGGVTVPRIRFNTKVAEFAPPNFPAVLTFTLTVTDGRGLASSNQNSPTATTVVYVGIEPIRALSVTNDSPTTIRQATHFTASVAGGNTGVTYHWDWGDGASYTAGAVITHAYASLGYFTATVTARDAITYLTASSQVTVTNQLPNLPGFPVPADSAVAVPLTQTLRWLGGDPDGQVVTYTLALGAYAPPPVMTTQLTLTTYYSGELAPLTRYYWIITATDGFSARMGPMWSFTTTQQPDMVYLPVVLEP